MSTDTVPLRRALWLFPFALTFHNLEEALWLPGWSQQAGALHPPVGTGEFHFAVGVVTAAGWWLTWMASRRGGRWLALAAGSWVLMLLNVLLPHVLATVLMHRYAPGVVTALMLNLPVNALLLRRALAEGVLTRRAIAWGAAVVVPTVAASLPVLFWVGRQIQ
ncbi:HXXEE domain-containing protein [Archangium violaceum]|uniref:HXXEE domain-containing protein n=1 Tax=Archangium violaceum TaxID=83451 RepID=UPI002B28392A|nr:HXXEE domain-containing protein [Archangium violaceum]